MKCLENSFLNNEFPSTKALYLIFNFRKNLTAQIKLVLEVLYFNFISKI